MNTTPKIFTKIGLDINDLPQQVQAVGTNLENIQKHFNKTVDSIEQSKNKINNNIKSIKMGLKMGDISPFDVGTYVDKLVVGLERGKTKIESKLKEIKTEFLKLKQEGVEAGSPEMMALKGQQTNYTNRLKAIKKQEEDALKFKVDSLNKLQTIETTNNKKIEAENQKRNQKQKQQDKYMQDEANKKYNDRKKYENDFLRLLQENDKKIEAENQKRNQKVSMYSKMFNQLENKSQKEQLNQTRDYIEKERLLLKSQFDNKKISIDKYKTLLNELKSMAVEFGKYSDTQIAKKYNIPIDKLNGMSSAREINSLNQIAGYNRALSESKATGNVGLYADQLRSYKIYLENILKSDKITSSSREAIEKNLSKVKIELNRSELKIKTKSDADMVASEKNKANQIKANAKATADYQKQQLQQATVRKTDNSLDGQKMNSLASYTTGASILYGAINGIKQIENNIKDVEKGSIQLNRVMPNATAEDMNSIKQSSFEIAKNTAQSVIDVQKIQNLWARANDEVAGNAEALKELTTITSQGMNIGGFESAEEAVSLLNATINQMGLSWKDAGMIMDSWNKVADTTAVKSAKDLANVVMTTGTMAKMLGVDIHELNGITGMFANNMSKTGAEVGTAMKTMFSYMLDENTIKLLDTYGVKVKKNAQEYNDFGNIMMQLNAKYKELQSTGNEVAIQEINKSLGRIRRSDYVGTAMQYYDQVAPIKQDSANSFGYANEQNTKMLETYASKLEQLKTSFVSFSEAIGESGLLAGLKHVVDLLSSGISAFDKINPVMKTLLVTTIAFGTALPLINKGFGSIFGATLVQSLTGLGAEIAIRTKNQNLYNNMVKTGAEIKVGSTVVSKEYALAIELENLAEGKNLILNKEKLASELALLQAKKAEIQSKIESTLASGAETTVENIELQAQLKNTQATIADTEARIANATVGKVASTSTSMFTTALTGLLNPVFLVTTAITLAIAGYAVYSDSVKKAKQEVEDFNKANEVWKKEVTNKEGFSSENEIEAWKEKYDKMLLIQKEYLKAKKDLDEYNSNWSPDTDGYSSAPSYDINKRIEKAKDDMKKLKDIGIDGVTPDNITSKTNDLKRALDNSADSFALESNAILNSINIKQKLKQENEDLINKYNDLKNKPNKNEDETKEYAQSLSQLSGVFPTLKKTLNEKTGAMELDTEKMRESIAVGGELYNMRLKEIESTGFSSEMAKAHSKAIMQQKIDSLSLTEEMKKNNASLIDDLEKTIKIIEGMKIKQVPLGDGSSPTEDNTKYNEAVNKLQIIAKAQSELIKTNKINGETLQKLVTDYPLLANTVDDYNNKLIVGDELLEKIKTQYVEQEKVVKDSFRSKLMNSDTYYKKMLIEHKGFFDDLSNRYTLDLKGYTSLAKAKAEIDKQIIIKMQSNWNTFFKNNANNMENFIRMVGTQNIKMQTSIPIVKEVFNRDLGINVDLDGKSPEEIGAYIESEYSKIPLLKSESSLTDKEKEIIRFKKEYGATVNKQTEIDKKAFNDFIESLKKNMKIDTSIAGLGNVGANDNNNNDNSIGYVPQTMPKSPALVEYSKEKSLQNKQFFSEQMQDIDDMARSIVSNIDKIDKKISDAEIMGFKEDTLSLMSEKSKLLKEQLKLIEQQAKDYDNIMNNQLLPSFSKFFNNPEIDPSIITKEQLAKEKQKFVNEITEIENSKNRKEKDYENKTNQTKYQREIGLISIENEQAGIDSSKNGVLINSIKAKADAYKEETEGILQRIEVDKQNDMAISDSSIEQINAKTEALDELMSAFETYKQNREKFSADWWVIHSQNVKLEADSIGKLLANETKIIQLKLDTNKASKENISIGADGYTDFFSEQMNMLTQIQENAHKKADELRALGLKDDSEAIQQAKTMYMKAEDEKQNMRKTMADGYVNIVKDALNKEYTAYETVINKERRLLDDLASTEDYNREIQKSDKEINEKKTEMEAISRDTSIEGQARYAKLKFELDNMMTSKEDKVRQHKREEEKKTLDKALEDKKADIDKRQTALEDYYSKEKGNIKNLEDVYKLFSVAQIDISKQTANDMITQYKKFFDYYKQQLATVSAPNSVSNNIQNSSVTPPSSSVQTKDVSTTLFNKLLQLKVQWDNNPFDNLQYETEAKTVRLKLPKDVQNEIARLGNNNMTIDELYFLKSKLMSQGRMYAKGGTVSHTGLAWVDGTSAKPEYMLNNNDLTSLLETIKISENIMNNIPAILNNNVTTNNNPIEIHIHSVPNESVDSLVSKVGNAVFSNLNNKLNNNGYRR